MDDWTEGYIADVDYPQGYYRELTPPFLAFALLAKGIRPPNPSGKLRYCELGAGHGFTCNVVAATHPGYPPRQRRTAVYAPWLRVTETRPPHLSSLDAGPCFVVTGRALPHEGVARWMREGAFELSLSA